MGGDRPDRPRHDVPPRGSTVSSPGLIIGAFRYDTTRALFSGDVGVEGATVEMRSASTIPEIFRRVLVDQEFDVAELGMTFYLRTFSPDSPYVAIPVFPNRVFRHSCVFVNVDSGIESPRDLSGTRIGEFGMYSQDSGVWAKGVLMDEYAFRPAASTWLIGGLDRPAAPFDFVPRAPAPGVDVRSAPEGVAPGPMLERGEIDALFTANVPKVVLDGSTRIRRLFVDHEAVERAYFARTGIFPLMHTVVLRRELVRRDPGLARRVFDAFLAAKDAAAELHRSRARLYHVQSMLPWTNALFERNTTDLPHDWWPYGVAANRAAIEANLRYHTEQGLVRRSWSVEEVFETSLLTT